MFGSLGLPELLVIVMLLGVLVVPLWLILRRVGLPPFVALVAFLPLAGVIVLWYIALARWPAVERNP